MARRLDKPDAQIGNIATTENKKTSETFLKRPKRSEATTF